MQRDVGKKHIEGVDEVRTTEMAVFCLVVWYLIFCMTYLLKYLFNGSIYCDLQPFEFQDILVDRQADSSKPVRRKASAAPGSFKGMADTMEKDDWYLEA